MYLEERRQNILDLIEQEGRAAVVELSQRFGVSEVTIRSDLQALEDQGMIVRTHGGAIPAPDSKYHLSLIKRRQQHIAEKRRIGEAGAAMIADGEAIFIDSSSTALAVAQRLKDRRDLTVITNGLVVAQEMLGHTNVTVVMPGGTLHHDTASLIDVEGLAVLEGLHIQTGYFGAHGLSLTAGLTDVSAPEAEVKRPLVRMCHRVVAVLDATKWGRAGLASFADLTDVDKILTDTDAPADLVASVRDLGIDVQCV